jgi:LPXTG-motif cell wall-anchored protein
VNLVGSGFQPDFTTEIFIDGISVGTVLTDGTGAFDTDRDVPEGAGPGTVTVSAACDATGANVSSSELTIPGDTPAQPTSTTVDQGAAADEGGLPQTGSDVEPLVIVGGLAILAGVAFVLVARRRRSDRPQV